MDWCSDVGASDLPPETLLDVCLRQPDQLERLDHRFGRLIADRSRRDLETVADHVVLVRLDRQRILIVERVEPTLRHREGIVCEIDLLLRSEEHTSELQSLMRISYAVFCLKK